jgi:transcriptional/translational regulatory protein YebC/TACO1
MFNRVGHVDASKAQEPDDLEGEAIEVGAQAVEKHGDLVSFTTEPGDLETVRAALQGRGWTIKMAELGYSPKNPATITDDQRKHVTEFLGELGGHDDVRRLHPAL